MMAKRVFLDIETLPPHEGERERILSSVRRELMEAGEAPDPTSLSKLADRRFRDLALKAEAGRVLAVGIVVEDGGRIIHRGVMGRERATRLFHLDEARTLRAFWRLIADFDLSRDLIVGHNLLDFDLPFLCKRSVINQVRPTVRFCFRRFRQQPLYDTMWEWTNWRERVKLHDLAEAFGLSSPKREGVDGGCIYDLFTAGHHEEIAEYCLRDVECVRAVYYRMNFMDLPSGETAVPSRQEEAGSTAEATLSSSPRTPVCTVATGYA